EGAVSGIDLVLLDPYPTALGEGHHVRTEVVDQRDLGGEQDLRAHVRVASGDGGGGVQHRCRAAGHQGLGGDPVDVQVVDHGDLAGAETLGQRLGAAVHAHHGERLGGGVLVVGATTQQ